MGVAKSASRTIVVGIAAVLTALGYARPPSVAAGAGDFDFAVERVIIDGNTWGPHDGTPDAVEETFDPRINPIYHIPNPPYGFVIPFDSFLGNSSPIDGALHLFSPGTVIDIPSVGVTTIQSDVLSVSPVLTDGAGDARFQVDFQAADLPVNQYVHATFMVSGPTGGVYASLAFANFDADMAARQLVPAITGPSMFVQLVSGPIIPLGGQSVAIDPASVGGPFSLAFDYDDTAKTLTPSYSLDGGVTFTGGLDPLPLAPFDGSGAGVAKLMIGADPKERFDVNACPNGLAHRLSKDVVSVARKRTGNKLTVKAEGWLQPAPGGFNGLSEGAQLVINDRGSHSDLVNLSAGAAVPPGGPGSGCDPRDGWTATSSTHFKYRNYSNALPPGCAPGSANGLTYMKATLTRSSILHLSATVMVPNDPASIVGPLSILFVRGQGDMTNADGACLAVQSNDTYCTPGGRSVRCKY